MAADACRATLHSGLAQFRAEYGPSACAVPFVDHVLAGHDNTTYGHVWSPIYSFFTRFVQHPAAVLSDRPSGVPTALRAPGDVNVALFIDGPEFYSRGPDGGALGRLGLRDRLLHARGYESVVSVPWHEWEALPGRAGQDAFVRDLLANLLQAQSR